MSGRALFSAAVLIGALVAIFIAVGPDLGGSDDGGEARAPAQREEEPAPAEAAPEKPTVSAEPTRESDSGGGNVAGPDLPENPDDVLGTAPYALTRPANLRRALRILDRERVRVEGVFDQLRVAPGRIDTSIETPSRTYNLQLRADFEIPFRSDHEFPNDSFPDFRRSGLNAAAVDPTVPGRMLRGIDRIRSGSAARDIDYFVIRRDSIDFRVGYGAYMSSGPRPRIVLLEDGKLRPVQ